MNRFLPFLGAILLTGCGMSEDKFAAELADASCSYYEECAPEFLDYFGGDFDSCVETVEAATLAMVNDESCEYDAGAAKKCVGEAKDYTCDAETGEDNADSACDDVCGDASGGDTGN